MKSLLYLFFLLSLLSNGGVNAQATTKDGSQPLFDGKTLNGWRNAQGDTLPEKSWSVENRELTFDPSKGTATDRS